MLQSLPIRLFAILFILLNTLSCRNYLGHLGSPNSYKWVREDEKVLLKDTLTFRCYQPDSLIGRYNFIISPGFEGRKLILGNNSNFSEVGLSDVSSRFSKGIKGTWNYSKGKVTLKRFRQKLNLTVHQYLWATFLVPESKTEMFAYVFNRNKYLIDSLSSHVGDMRGYQIDYCLYDFRTFCYIRRVKNKFEKFTN